VGSWDEAVEAKRVEDVRPIANIAMEEFLSGEYKRVAFFYTRFLSALSQKPVQRTLLPVKSATAEKIIQEVHDHDKEGDGFQKESMKLYMFEPSEERVLSEVIPRLVEILIFEGALEAVASEHSARMVAMKNATDNAKSIAEDLTLSFNRARQASVTREISEITAGAEALES
jgi:F-type H+-transporting ATPase subunit gamma